MKMNIARFLMWVGVVAVMGSALVGCESKPAPLTTNPVVDQSRTAAAQSNPAVAPVLNDPKTSDASKDYVKKYLPSNGGTNR